MFNPSRGEVRQFFRTVYRKHRERQPLSPIESMALEIILEHPEDWKRVEMALRTSGKPWENANKSKKYQTDAVMPENAPLMELADGKSVMSI